MYSTVYISLSEKRFDKRPSLIVKHPMDFWIQTMFCINTEYIQLFANLPLVHFQNIVYKYLTMQENSNITVI